MGIIRTLTKNSGNPMMSCFNIGAASFMFITNPTIKLILCEGTTKVVKRRTKIKAGEIMFEFPDCVVCHADSFFLGRPIPILSIHDHLMAGHTYFVLPLDRLPPGSSEGGSGQNRGGLLSAASLCSLGSPSDCPTARPGPTMLKVLNGDNSTSSSCTNKSPFEYVKDKDGRVLMIKVVPEFITRIITTNNTTTSPNHSSSLICSTPELQKQYEQLVRAKDQVWSPKLETISEHKMKFTPSRFIRLEWKITKG